MKKFLLILLIILIILIVFSIFALQYDFGKNFFDGIIGVFFQSSSSPPRFPN